jgi:hypothetical protein
MIVVSKANIKRSFLSGNKLKNYSHNIPDGHKLKL